MSEKKKKKKTQRCSGTMQRRSQPYQIKWPHSQTEMGFTSIMRWHCAIAFLPLANCTCVRIRDTSFLQNPWGGSTEYSWMQSGIGQPPTAKENELTSNETFWWWKKGKINVLDVSGWMRTFRHRKINVFFSVPSMYVWTWDLQSSNCLFPSFYTQIILKRAA